MKRNLHQVSTASYAYYVQFPCETEPTLRWEYLRDWGTPVADCVG